MPEKSLHRVVVTGLGAVSALGNDIAGFWRCLCEGECGIGPLTRVATGELKTRVAAEVKNFAPHRRFDKRQLNLLDPFAQFALVATDEAVSNAGLSFSDGLGARTAIVLGNCIGGDAVINQSALRLYGQKKAGLHPLTIPRAMNNAAVSHIAIKHGITGPAFTISSACASATHAIGQAYWMVRHGMVSAAVAGGSEACLTLGTFKAWEALRVMAADTCRPFSRGRKGLVLGEGAGTVVLESMRSAVARGAPIYAELAGFGMSADAADIVHPSVNGIAAAMKRALSDAELAPDRVDYVNAHGTGTQVNDATETGALHRVFGAHATKLAISSTKSMHGHALGASGALEAIATVLAVHNGAVPPTVNYSGPDPDCDLDYTPNLARDMPVRAALTNSFAFGGLNAVLAVRQFA